MQLGVARSDGLFRAEHLVKRAAQWARKTIFVEEVDHAGRLVEVMFQGDVNQPLGRLLGLAG